MNQKVLQMIKHGFKHNFCKMNLTVNHRENVYLQESSGGRRALKMGIPVGTNPSIKIGNGGEGGRGDMIHFILFARFSLLCINLFYYNSTNKYQSFQTSPSELLSSLVRDISRLITND